VLGPVLLFFTLQARRGGCTRRGAAVWGALLRSGPMGERRTATLSVAAFLWRDKRGRCISKRRPVDPSQCRQTTRCWTHLFDSPNGPPPFRAPRVAAGCSAACTASC
jgi:hypothetical protein